MIRYGLRRRLRTGILVRIRPTFECNLNCPYCGNKMGYLEERPREKFTLSAKQWLDLIDKIPFKVREVWISGGEPSVYKDFIPLVEGLLKRRYLITILSNLMHPRLAKIPTSDLIRIEATFHGRVIQKDKFLKNLAKIKNRADVVEIADNKLSFSKSKPWDCDIEDARRTRFRSIYISPHGTIHWCAYDETMSL